MSAEAMTSIWNVVSPPGPDLASLDGDLDTDVVVIGAGFTGLSTALYLTEKDVEVVVLEAVEPGWGASGRNNGQVIPTLTRPDPDTIIERHGEAGERFVGLLRDSADYLYDVVRRYKLAAEAEQTGWIQPVHTPGRMKIAEHRVAQWSKHGAPVELLDREQVRDLTGSELWHGGWANPTGGHVNPLALSRELARSVVKAGARIFVRTPAQSLRYDNQKWIVETSSGHGRQTDACDQRVYR
jgi:glycine/D-amino acid oxidase-like deaminating enzyme